MAVAPVLNFSGEPAFDPVVASDLLASELTQLGDVTVIPVNRVVAALLRSETPHIRSPEHALDICRAVGSDAILVPAITEFSPYPPMTVGLTMELYVLPELVTTVEDDLSSGPLRQMQRVYDASHDATVDRVRQYADTRSTDVGPVEWRRCLLTQDRYLRFCFHEGLRELFLGESVRMVVAQTSDEEE